MVSKALEHTFFCVLYSVTKRQTRKGFSRCPSNVTEVHRGAETFLAAMVDTHPEHLTLECVLFCHTALRSLGSVLPSATGLYKVGIYPNNTHFNFLPSSRLVKTIYNLL